VSDGLPVQETLDLDQVLTVTVPFMPVEVEPLSYRLPEFSGRNTRCAKCGISSETPANYHDGVTLRHTEPCYRAWQTLEEARFSVPFPEHIDRRCPVCRYEWTEALADLEKVED
jgi:hypothetical protein